MCTPELGWQILLISGLSMILMKSVCGPVAFITHFALMSKVLPRKINKFNFCELIAIKIKRSES